MAHAARTTSKSQNALFWLLPWLWIVGCSQRTDRVSNQPAESLVQDLAAPVTVTLTTPPSVSPIAPVLNGVNSVYFEGSSSVLSGTVVAMGSVGGGVHTEPDVLINETWSRGTAEIGARVHVRGTLHAANRQLLGTNSVIDSIDPTPVFDPASTLSWNVTYPSAAVGPSVTVNAGQTGTLAPGQYGDVLVNSRGTLKLSAGTYYLKSLDIEPQSTVTLDQAAGPVIIYENDKVILRGSFVVPAGGSPDLLIVGLSSTAILVESLFDGAIVSPSAIISMNAVSGVHTGFFYGRDIQRVHAGAKVQYRAPLAILKAASPSGPKCRELLSAPGIPGTLALNVQRYCSDGVCASGHYDTDFDTIEDCLDECPYDPRKSKPGICGCSRAETDRDGDGVPDCIDECPDDPNNTSVGECGCVGGPGPALKPAGTPCNDTACPQTGATCNGAGVCGNRAACTPATGCKLVAFGGISYWFCPGVSGDGGTGQAPEASAQATCSAKGLTLARIDTAEQNRLIARFLKSPLWLGANDLGTSGTWRWSAPGTNNGDPFWSGGPSGTRVNNLYSNWGRGAPGAQRCAAIRPDGQWFDADCAEPLGYACQFKIPLIKRPGGLGLPRDAVPAFTNCVQEANSGLPSTLDELIRQVDAGVTDGAFKNPPPAGATCPDNPGADGVGRHPDAGEGCALVNVQPLDGGTCFDNSDCARFGAGFVCKEYKDDPNCTPPAGGPDSGAPTGPVDGATCQGHKRCGQLSCPTDNLACDQVNVCGVNSDFDAGVDPTSNVDAEAFDPAALFEGGIPDAARSVAYVDDPIRGDAGRNHAWCFMNPQNQNSVPPVSQPPKSKKGKSGSSSLISFDFDPQLTFDVQANPLALGETDLHLHAAATLTAGVHLNQFLGQDYSANILDVGVGILAKRCSLSDKETRFQVLGLDFIDPEDLGIPIFDTLDPVTHPDLAKIGRDCDDAVAKFVLYANRAKKAFRDAQQLVHQYKQITSLGNLLSGDLCQQIGVLAADVPGFPGGNICLPHEPVEMTINRFIDYYQGPGSGQVAQLKEVAGALSKISSALADGLKTNATLFQFKGLDKQESQTVLSVPFAIGPVPMLLEIDAFARYGIIGKFDVGLNFGTVLNLDAAPKDDPQDPNNPPNPQPDPLAKVTAQVVPHAAAGLSAFVGAGTNLGAFSATVGIEGSVNLADIQAPIFAGVGLNVLVTKDIRPIPADIADSVLSPKAFQFSIPKAFKFSVGYGYGAAVDLKDVLNGEINSRLRIKFFFFSRTWRKRVVKFNGWSAHFDLVSGGSGPDFRPDKIPVVTNPVQSPAPLDPETERSAANVAQGASSDGIAETQVPLMTLAHLIVPGGDLLPGTGIVGDDDGGGGGIEQSQTFGPLALAVDGGTGDGSVVAFDPTAVQGFFYDDLCCIKAPDQTLCSISGVPQCCPGFTCTPFVDSPRGMGSCQARCKTTNEKCQTASDCCAGDGGAAMVCGSLSTCTQCGQLNGNCARDVDCCGGLSCAPNHKCVVTCQAVGQSCTSNASCCMGQGLRCDTSKNQCCTIANALCTSDAECCQGSTGAKCTAGACVPNIIP
jgi:hypothetical protein